eukprot:jgi/Picre1/27699/NNA_000663.t1
MATMLCKRHGGKVKVCVQQSLGTGVFQGTPLALSGVRRILLQMDWGEVSDQIEIGQLGRDQIDDCQTYILISPQNITGHSVLPLISEMVDEAHADKKEIIMVNPQLGDIMSSGGVMSVQVVRSEWILFPHSQLPTIFVSCTLAWAHIQLWGRCDIHMAENGIYINEWISKERMDRHRNRMI